MVSFGCQTITCFELVLFLGRIEENAFYPVNSFILKALTVIVFLKTVCIRFPCILFHYILFNTYYGLSFMKDVSSNHLGTRGCQWMCDMLQNNVTLLKINLSDNDFNDKDTVFLLDALKVQKQRNRLICIFTANVNHLWHVQTKFSLYLSSLAFICSFFFRISQIESEF